MAEKDITEKLLEDYNDVFADIVNVLILGDNDQIQENELETTRTVSQYKAANAIHGEDRDVSKFWAREKIKISLIGFENQTIYDVDEVFHVIGHDGAAYRDELNYGEARYPVITLVLYFGTDRHWGNNRRSLHQVFSDMPQYLKPYVNDYKINVFEIAWLSDEQVAKFKSDFRIVADYFVQMRKNKKYTPSREEMTHVNAVLDFMKAMSSDKAFIDVQNESRKGENKTMSMADWFDEQLEQCRAEERKKTEESMATWFDEQLEQCRAEERKKAEEVFDVKEARTFVTNVDSLAKNAGWSTEEACAKLNSSLADYEKAKKLLAAAEEREQPARV